MAFRYKVRNVPALVGAIPQAIIRGSMECKVTLQLPIGVKISEAGKASTVYANVLVPGKGETDDDAVLDRLLSVAKVNVTMPARGGEGQELRVKLAPVMSGERVVCVAVFLYKRPLPDALDNPEGIDRFIAHLAACGVVVERVETDADDAEGWAAPAVINRLNGQHVPA